MMERSNKRKLILVNGFIFCFFILFRSTYTQEGFLSIKCCTDTKYTDSNTNITYTPDNDWYPERSNCQNLHNEVNNDAEYEKARFFSSVYGNKWCYNLETVKDQNYMVRGTFPCQDQEGPSQGSFSFDVFIGVTQIGTVNSSNDTIIEGIFTATGDYVNFCLEKQYGDPYISRLELRPLSDSSYLNGESSNVLKTIKRVDAGNEGYHIRSPYDTFDRIWSKEKDLNPKQTAERIFLPNATSLVPTDTTAPPIQVLQTALTHTDRLEFLHPDLDTENYIYGLNLYFLELNDTVQSGQRVFDIYINNEKGQEVDILEGGSRYKAISTNFTANGPVNLTLVKASKGSQYGPIINAYEILQVCKWVEGTSQEDVDAIVKVRGELLKNNQNNEVFETWSGDPCLPLSWHGLSCKTTNNSLVISKMNLSSSKIKGQLPPSITELVHLKELNMSCNEFTGTIPEFKVSSLLTSMDLSHNDLMGKIPDSLTSNPNLKLLNYGCNPQFSKEAPASLNSSTITTDKGECDSRRPSHQVQHIVIGVVVSASIVIITAVVIFLACFYKRKSKPEEKFMIKRLSLPKNVIFSIPSIDDVMVKSISIENFTQACIENATQKYRTLIGEGGFGSVYRGTLNDGQEVAVKVLSATSTQGTREFENELNLLSTIQHENLVPLLGYCCENEQQMLVYPYMSNGSLQDRLYGEAAKRKILDWPTRISIALGAARGLTYLHTFPARAIIHRDVKSSNILLDHSMCAKVADFGFSKYAPQEGDSNASIEVRGTAGYLDPEYYSTQQLSAKSDVFSFGVVLLEIVSGKEPLNIHRPRNEWSLVEWHINKFVEQKVRTHTAILADGSKKFKAKPLIRNSRIDEIVDPSIKGGYHAEAMWRVVEVALACIEPFSAYRPCMVDIVRELEDALIIENNASEYMKSIDSFNASNRFSIERILVIPPTPILTDASPILSQPPPPQPR